MRYTFKQFRKQFPNDDVCLEYIFKARFGTEPICPICKKAGFFYKVKNRKCYACSCGYQISPTTNTIFHKSATKLTDWLFAIYLMSTSKNGVSAKELERHLGTTYKTAWRIAHKIRGLMKQDNEILKGTIEVDEMYVGGSSKNTLRKKRIKKTAVMGMVSREGKSKAQVVEEADTRTAMKFIKKNIRAGSKIISDDSYIYHKVKKLGFSHSSIRHSKDKYVKGNIYTNSIEGFWSQIKRSIHGTYHSVSPKHLQSYVDEFSFQYNNRFSEMSLFETLLSRLCGQHALKGQKSVSLKLRKEVFS